MEVSTDRWCLNRHKMFKLLREASPENISKSKNIMCFNNGIIYVWNCSENNLFSLNIKTLNISTEEDLHQVLMPSDPPTFDVTCIRVNKSGTLCAVSGSKGVAVLELPKRWGKYGLFQGGKNSIFVKCSPLDGRYLSCNGDIVLQVRWHPASESDDQLIVLTSSNDLRIYKTIPVDSMNLLAVWPLGRSPISVPYLASLGDIAVDFDFAPPIVTDTNEENLELLSILWPILVLFGNGDVFLITSPAISKTRQVIPKVAGPLCMYPAADDNYGTDASSLLILPSAPPIVVIAMSSGTVYHCLLMSSMEETSNEESNLSNNSLNTSTQALYVFESIEFELGLSLDDDDQQLFSCPIFLHRDPIFNSRYFCSHDTGINVINIPFTQDLETFAAAKDENIDLCLPSFEHHSSSEYLVCTHVSNSSKHQPVLGLTIVDSPSTLVAFLGSGEVISLPLTSFSISPSSVSSPENKVDSVKKSQKQPFDVHIKNLLSSPNSASRPLLKLNSSSEPSPQECLELITRVTRLFREEHFPKYEMVKDEISRRVRILRNMKKRQVEEIKELEQKKGELQAAAEKLADKYEEANEKQEILTKRAEKIVMTISCLQPTSNQAEKKMAADLQIIKEKVEKFKLSIEQIKSKQAYQLKNLEASANQRKNKEIYLSLTKEKAIKSNLENLSSEIRRLKSRLETLKTETNELCKT